VHLVAEFEVPPDGVDELGLSSVAPALCNAIFAAAGNCPSAADPGPATRMAVASIHPHDAGERHLPWPGTGRPFAVLAAESRGALRADQGRERTSDVRGWTVQAGCANWCAGSESGHAESMT